MAKCCYIRHPCKMIDVSALLSTKRSEWGCHLSGQTSAEVSESWRKARLSPVVTSTPDFHHVIHPSIQPGSPQNPDCLPSHASFSGPALGNWVTFRRTVDALSAYS